MNKNNLWNVNFHNRTKKQFKKLRSSNAGTKNEIHSMIKKISINPFYYGDSLELYKEFGRDCYARKTSRGGRVVYSVNKTTQHVLVLSLCGHYGDNGGF